MQDQHITNSTNESEEWRSIPAYEGLYSVSSFGRVRCDYSKSGTYAGRIFTITPRNGGTGYCVVMLSRDGLKEQLSVHRLVLAAFVGPCPDGMVTNHIDAVRHNNHVSNLEYVTQSQNVLHAVALGRAVVGDAHWSMQHPERIHRGESNVSAVLTDAQAADIATALNAGETGASLSRKYGVSQSTISRIKRGKRFSG